MKLKDVEFFKYCHLDVDWNASPITKNNLPSDFSNKAIKLADIFRKKTINLDFECFLYFDYISGELIYCFVNDDENSSIEEIVDETQFEGKHIASIHNHPKNYLSAPSGVNFQILDLEFEDYELISGHDELWIIEAKGIIKNSSEIKKIIFDYYFDYLIGNISHLAYKDFLINYLNDNEKNIKITKKEFD